jgi:hypothetical protein
MGVEELQAALSSSERPLARQTTRTDTARTTYHARATSAAVGSRDISM